MIQLQHLYTLIYIYNWFFTEIYTYLHLQASFYRNIHLFTFIYIFSFPPEYSFLIYPLPFYRHKESLKDHFLQMKGTKTPKNDPPIYHSERLTPTQVSEICNQFILGVRMMRRKRNRSPWKSWKGYGASWVEEVIKVTIHTK